MSRYLPGDVILVSLSLDNKQQSKVRPALVLEAGEENKIVVLPISSRPPSDSAFLPLSIDDFETGGLDLFSESFVLLSQRRSIRSGEVIGKRGSVSSEYLRTVQHSFP